jgi:hypothetical protein
MMHEEGPLPDSQTPRIPYISASLSTGDRIKFGWRQFPDFRRSSDQSPAGVEILRTIVPSTGCLGSLTFISSSFSATLSALQAIRTYQSPLCRDGKHDTLISHARPSCTCQDTQEPIYTRHITRMDRCSATDAWFAVPIQLVQESPFSFRAPSE